MRCALPAPYVAGIIDGEGYVGAVRTRQGATVVRVSVTNKHVGLIRTLQLQYGGEARRTHDQVWQWVVNARLAEKVLREVAALLVIKKEQSIACLALRGTMTTGHGVPVDPSVLIERERLYRELRALNRRDPTRTLG